MGLPLKIYEYYDNSGGLDLKSSPIKDADDDSTASLNVDYSTDGAVFTRNGSSRLNSTQLDQLVNLGLYDYKKSDGTEVQVFQNGSKIYHNLSTPSPQVTGLDDDAIPDFEFIVTNDDEYLLWGNGINTNRKFNGSSWTNLSITTPGNPTVTDLGVGVLGAGSYSYYIAFVRRVAGVIVQISDLNPTAQNITIAANRQIRITRPAITDSQVDGWVIYRRSPTSLGVYYQLIDGSANPVIVSSASTTYDDNIATDGTIEAEFDNQPAPDSGIFEEFGGRIYYVPADGLYLLPSKPYLPWNVPEDGGWIPDGKINCLKRLYNCLIISTSNGSLWVLTGDLEDVEPQKISSNIGVMNNRCIDGPGPAYMLATNKKFYELQPTDFGTSQLRITEPISIRVEPLIGQISNASLDKVQVLYYSAADQAKLMVSAPFGIDTNNAILIFNETQTFQKKKPCWQYWDNLKASSMAIFRNDGEIVLYSGDYNGFLWKLDDSTLQGDGAEVNGTSTSAGASTLTDLSQNWTVNAYAGMTVRIIGNPGIDQVRTIVSNTSTAVTVDSAWTTQPSASAYTIGGYDSYHYTNWKSITGSYDTLKQLWFILSNMNASGDYEIDLIIQYDFNTTISDQTVLNINLQASNTIWGQFIWGQAPWGAQSVFQDRIRIFGRFRAVRFGFRTREAGHPFQLNGFSVSVQDKGLFY